MTWFEFRSKVDEYLAENQIDPQEVEIWYFEIRDKIENLEVVVEKFGAVKPPTLRLFAS